MLLIKTSIGPSKVHGTGLFAVKPIKKGELVWRYEPAFDMYLPDEEIARMEPVMQEYIRHYGYRCEDLPDGMVLNGDDARFMNHDSSPNTIYAGEEGVAARDIAAGEELTCDYGSFDMRDHAAMAAA